MTKKYAVIVNEIVTNIILLDPEEYENYTSNFDSNTQSFIDIENQNEISIGWLYTNGQFVDNNPVTNETIVMEQVLQVANT
jgi:hypothetical protein